MSENLDNAQDIADTLRKALDPDQRQIEDGIAHAQWKEWSGETVTLGPEETKWICEQLDKLFG